MLLSSKNAIARDVGPVLEFRLTQLASYSRSVAWLLRLRAKNDVVHILGFWADSMSRTIAGIADLVSTYRALGRTSPEMAPDDVALYALGTPSIRPLQVKSELIGLARLVDHMKPRRVVEIGTARGGTLYVFCKLSAPDAAIISIDFPGKGRFGGGYKWYREPILKRFAGRQQKLHLLKGDSHSTKIKEDVIALLDGPIDILFIDGDHTYQGVKLDFAMYRSLVRPGGTIIFHDICQHSDPHCQVSQLWNELKGSHRHTEIVEDWGQAWAGIGILHV